MPLTIEYERPGENKKILWLLFYIPLDTGWNTVRTTTETIWNGISGFFSGIWDGVMSTVSTILDGIMFCIDTGWNTVRTTTETIWNGINTFISTTWENIRNTLDLTMESIRTMLNEKWEAAKTDISNTMDAISTNVSSAWDAVKSNVSGAVENVKSSISTGFTAAKSTVSNIFTSIRTTIGNAMSTARSTVSNAISAIRGAFNFSWSLPHLKLPHISISGRFSINPPSVPHFSISWYKKAMENGMILNGPTIFGQKGNTLLAGGEAGSEAVVGTQSLMDMIRDAVASMANQTTINYGGVNINVYQKENQDIRALADEIEYRINNNVMRRRAVTGA